MAASTSTQAAGPLGVSTIMPTDPYELMHWNMVIAHNAFKLGYDSIVSALANPPTNDLPNFLGYCESWASTIEEHHDVEEHVVFPLLNQKMDFAGEAEQHRAIHAILGELTETIHTCKADPSKFDAEAMRALMTRFREPLYAHLDAEVEHITAANIKAAGFAGEDMQQMIADLETYAKAKTDPFLNVPFMCGHVPTEYKAAFPPVGWVLRKVVFPMLAWRHSGYWKYAPYPMS